MLKFGRDFVFQDHSRCYSDCSFSHTENNRTLTFDFSAMSDVASLTIGPSFTSKGTKYLHLFNISLCGHEVYILYCIYEITLVKQLFLSTKWPTISYYIVYRIKKTNDSSENSLEYTKNQQEFGEKLVLENFVQSIRMV